MTVAAVKRYLRPSQGSALGAITRLKGRSPLTFRLFSRYFVATPAATNLAPLLLISDKSLSPLSSMKVTSLRSTTLCVLSALWCPCSQHAFSSETQAPANCPHSVHRCSVLVCV